MQNGSVADKAPQTRESPGMILMRGGQKIAAPKEDHVED